MAEVVNTVEDFLEKSYIIAKDENLSQEEVILFNIQHLEAALKNNISIIRQMKVVMPCVEARIRPLKVQIQSLCKQTMTPANRKAISKGNRNLALLRASYATMQRDREEMRKALIEDVAKKKLAVDTLREYYKRNPSK